VCEAFLFFAIWVYLTLKFPKKGIKRPLKLINEFDRVLSNAECYAIFKNKKTLEKNATKCSSKKCQQKFKEVWTFSLFILFNKVLVFDYFWGELFSPFSAVSKSR
jgi:hypothetical protein